MAANKQIIGISRQAMAIRAFIETAARYDFPVLLVGETGVGKEVAARNIHYLSRRLEGPFIPVNCSCISQGVAESELFGHRKGSFTDSKEDKLGLIEASDGGTLFFDELSDLPANLQPKILRVIEDKEVRRVGEVYTRRVDTRFIFATNKDLSVEAKYGRFRKDLFYRVNTLSFHIPPLRERKEDVPIFIEQIVSELNAGIRANKKMGPNVLRLLINHSFPGNVRELENIIRRAYVTSIGDDIEAGDFLLEADRGEEEETVCKLYRRMVEGTESFWEVVHKPFIKRDLNRKEVKRIIIMGLKEVGGSYKELMELFRAGRSEKEYKQFMSVLNCHSLKSRSDEIQSAGNEISTIKNNARKQIYS